MKNIVKQFIQAVENRDAEGAAKFFADDINFENVPENSVITGKQAVYEKFKGFFEMTSKIQWQIEHELFSDDLAFIERKAHICFQGKNIVMPIVSVIKIVDEKITLFRDYFDSQTFANQLA